MCNTPYGPYPWPYHPWHPKTNVFEMFVVQVVADTCFECAEKGIRALVVDGTCERGHLSPPVSHV